VLPQRCFCGREDTGAGPALGDPARTAARSSASPEAIVDSAQLRQLKQLDVCGNDGTVRALSNQAAEQE
jgi:hypothetical protein